MTCYTTASHSILYGNHKYNCGFSIIYLIIETLVETYTCYKHNYDDSLSKKQCFIKVMTCFVKESHNYVNRKKSRVS